MNVKTTGRLAQTLKVLSYLKGLRLQMLCNLLNGFAYRISPIAISFIVSLMVGDILAGETENIHIKLYISVGLIVLRALFGYIDMIISHDIAYKILHKLRFAMYERLEEAVPIYTEDINSGDILSAASSDVELLEWFYAHTINTAVIMVSIIACVLIVIGSISIYILPIVMTTAILNILIPILFTKISQKTGGRVRQDAAKIESTLTDQIQGLREILSFSYENAFQKKLRSKMSNFSKSNMSDARRRSHEQAISLIINSGSLLLVLIVSNSLICSGQLEIRWVPSLLILTSSIYAPLGEFMNMANQFGQIFGSAERVIKVLEYEPEVKDEGKLMLDSNINTIEFKDVGLTYPNSSTPALENVSFVIEAGKNTAISGVSGAGKTTIANLLVRFLNPSSGTILVNNHNIKDYNLKSLRNKISLISQRVYLFNTTVFNNIHLGDPNASNQKVLDASKKSMADDFISILPDKYQTTMGETGARVSGGERQRISIARALLKNGDIIIFDEAQSDVDSASEERLNKMIKSLTAEQKTVITIAHRNSTIKNADKIIYLREGKIDQIGSYSELSQNKNFRSSVMNADGEK